MIKKYKQFNESADLKYPYRKVYFEVNSKDDIIKIYDYLDSILEFNIQRPITLPDEFPNFIGVPTDIYSLQMFKIPSFSHDMVTKDRIDRFIKNYRYDPDILQMKDLKLLKSIIFKGEKIKIKIPVYNEPRKLVYEGINHLLNFKLFEQKEELSTYKLKKRWDKKRSAIKELQHNIIKLRNKVFKDMDSDDEKTMIVATIVRIIDKTGERVGNENSKDIGHYGISHLMKKHITLNKDEVTLSYVGKSGVKHKVTFTDYKVARNLKKLKLNKYSEVFTTSHGLSIKSTQVNKYLVDFNITSKDLRGFKVNKLMSEKLRRTKKPNTDGELKRVFNDILREVAEEIGHTPGICRKNYLLPEIEKEWYDRKKESTKDMKRFNEFINEGYELYNIDKKLYLLKSYIKILQNYDNVNKDLMITYFTIIHNFLIIERLFYDDVKMCNKEINKNLEISKLETIEDVEEIFYVLYDSYNKVRYAIETFDSIEPIKIYLQEHPNVYEKLMKKKKG